MGWTSQLLRRLVVGFPLPPATGIGIIAGTGPYLPPPLDTYLEVGIVWVSEGTMSYIGVVDVAGTKLTEYGFVHSGGTIIPMVQQGENGASGYWDFVGGANYVIGFRNSPTIHYEDALTLYDDGFVWYDQLSGAGAYTIDPVASDSFLYSWRTIYDTASLFSVESMPTESSGVFSGDFSWTITSYGITTSAGVYNECSVVWTAPQSGIVTLDFRSQLLNSATTNSTFVSPETREGAVVGSGTVVQAAADTRAMVSGTTSAAPGQCWVGAFCTITGLTPGATYNSRLLHRVTAGTGRTLVREMIVRPSF